MNPALTNPFTVLPHSNNVQAGRETAMRKRDEHDQSSKREVSREAKVIKYLLNHPESTADEVYNATGMSVMTNTRFLLQAKGEDDVTRWTVNTLKYRRYLRTGKIYRRCK